jgi:hypothetical protein
VIIGVKNTYNFGCDCVEVGPIMRIFLGEDGFSSEVDLKGSDMRKDDILIGVGIDILILCYFEGYEMRWYHIANDFQVG